LPVAYDGGVHSLRESDGDASPNGSYCTFEFGEDVRCRKRIDLTSGKVAFRSKIGTKSGGREFLISLAVGLHHFEKHDPRTKQFQIDG
jgi:hypothetical protein